MICVEDKIADEASKLLPEVYGDVCKPTAKLLGNNLEKSAKMLLSPIRGLLWGWEQIEIWICDIVNNKIQDIPSENIKHPAPEIAVPLIEAMRYSANNETLREMYSKLLVNSMDTRQDKNTHPSYVDIIKQMNSLDAILFNILKDKHDYIKAINPRIGEGETAKGHFYSGALPEWYIGISIAEYDMFDISAGLLRLNRLGLIDLMFDRTAGIGDYNQLTQTEEIQNQLQKFKLATNDFSLIIKKTDSVINVNDFGKQFAKVCL